MLFRLLFIAFSLPQILTGMAAGAENTKVILKESFDTAEIGKLPTGFTSFAGAFRVQQEGDARFLELPGAPLDSFGVLFGPSEKPPLTVSAKIFATKSGRKFPAFAVSLGGVGGYRLQVSAAKKALEIFKADEPRQLVPFEWKANSWTSLRLQVRKEGERWVVEGKAWPAEASEPAEWAIKYEAPEEPAAGKPGLWGNPFSGTPIRYDDLVLSPVS